MCCCFAMYVLTLRCCYISSLLSQVLQLCTDAFSDYLANATVNNFFNVQVRTYRIEYFHKNSLHWLKLVTKFLPTLLRSDTWCSSSTSMPTTCLSLLCLLWSHCQRFICFTGVCCSHRSVTRDCVERLLQFREERYAD